MVVGEAVVLVLWVLEMLLVSWLEMLVFDTCGGTVVEKNEKD